MKKILLVVVCCMLFSGCGNDSIDNDVSDNMNQNVEQSNENISTYKIDIDKYEEIKLYSTDLIEKLNSINNQNILTYKGATYEKNIYFVEYSTNDDTTLLIRFNKDFKFIGITLQNPFFEEYTENFIQIRSKYLSIAPFYENCINISHCSNIIFGIEDGTYTIDNIEISNYNTTQTFVTKDITM